MIFSRLVITKVRLVSYTVARGDPDNCRLVVLLRAACFLSTLRTIGVFYEEKTAYFYHDG